MSMFTKKGADAVGSATAEKETKSSALVSFKSGTTLKVRVKSAEDSVEYYGYGYFGKVHTFVPKNPAQRNAKGYIESNPTVWDQAADYYYAEAKKAKDAGNTTESEKLSSQAYNFKGKPKYLVAFGNLETGEDIVVDLTPKQAKVIFAAIKEYEDNLGEIAFKLTKTGSSTDTVVTLAPIINMAKGLTDVERANFEKCGEKPFDFAKFEDCLYVADENEQIKNLVTAGFDIGKIGLTYNGSTQSDEEVTSVSEDTTPEVNF